MTINTCFSLEFIARLQRNIKEVVEEMIPFQFCAFLICSSLLYEGVFAYDEFHKACVMTHNKLRKLHGAQALTYSEELGQETQNWCDELAMKDELSHDNTTMDTKNVGENLAATPVSDAKSKGATPDLCTLAVQKWYAEEPNYNYVTGLPKGPGMPIKHFAQVVWNSTFQIGVGTARSTAHGDIICVRYSPRGAEGGPDIFKENIFPMGSMANDSSVKDLDSKNFPGYISSSNDPQGQAGGIKGSMSCGVGRSSRIVGGTQAKPAEFPWQVGFRWRTAYSMTNLFCGGTLIDKEWVVSAAHCFQKSRDISQLRVVLGEFDVNNEDGNEVEIGVDKVINHGSYNKETFDNDIALVHLKNEVLFNDFMKPACLPTKSSSFPPQKMCTVTGFGTLREGGPQTTVLMKADVPIVANDKCSNNYGPISDLKLCAGYDQGRIDACQGDSGGPLVCSQNGKAFLAGVVSYGIGCARPGHPGVYANVKSFIDWIETKKRS